MSDPAKFTDVIYQVRDRAAWIIINRPKVYNAFRGQTVEELIQAFQLAANDRSVSSIVLTAAPETRPSAPAATSRRMKGGPRPSADTSIRRLARWRRLRGLAGT
jgi:1,4-dihydroxy-2-naphthoyl-CoA synthase